MKIAEITSKNYQTGQWENEGKAVLLNCLDSHNDRGFYELRFINDMGEMSNTTQCRWVSNSDISEVD